MKRSNHFFSSGVVVVLLSFSSIMSMMICEKSMAFFGVITGFPVRFSMACRAFPAIFPPLLATCLFSSKVCGCSFFDISVVVASASMFKTNSKVVILSRRFSFFKPLKVLYCRVVMPL